MPKTHTLVLLPLVLLTARAHAGAQRDWRPSYYGYGRSQPAAELIVRPDTLTIGFSLRRVGLDPTAVVAQLQALVEQLGQRAQPLGGAVRMRSVSIDPAGEKQQPDARAVTVEGLVEMPLAPDADFWARAKLETQALAIFKPLTDEKRAPAVRVDRPDASLRDPEPHRAALLKRWIERARSFTAAAQSPSAPLVPVGCAPPGDIVQVHLGLDEVGLSLPVSCRLDAPAHP